MTGKGGTEMEGGKADVSAEAAGEPKAEKKPKTTKAAVKTAKPASPKAPRAKAEKKGGSTTRTPRKAGGA